MITVSHLSVANHVHDISFEIPDGGRFGLIGPSGSGKSLTALSIMGLMPATGSVRIDDAEVIGLSERRLRSIRGTEVAIVFQEPMSALDPLMPVGKQIAEAARSRGAVAGLLSEVSLPADVASRYPHELSGGQRQRVMIAMAIARRPRLLICDEPTTALDASTQERILDLLDRLVEEHGMSLLFISHDMDVVRRMCTTGAVLQEGRIVSRSLSAAEAPLSAAADKPVGDVIISASSLTRRHGSVTSLDDLNLEVRRGERLGIVGASGSGKTSLLNILAGLDKPTSGDIRVDGSVQMVFQDPRSSLDPRMRIEDSILEAAPGADVAKLLDSVGIPASAAKRYPAQFSGGQRQRISIARAIAAKPDILLADEPVTALDADTRDQVLELLDALIGDITLVFVSHDLGVVRHLCPSVAVIDGGAIAYRGPIADLRYPLDRT